MSELVKTNMLAIGSFCRIDKSISYHRVIECLSAWQRKKGGTEIGRIRRGRPGQAENTIEDLARIIVHGNQTFVMEFPKRDMEGPMISAQVTKRASGQTEAFAHAHARGANQKDGIAEQVVSLA